jgi:hypothetical protein
MSSHFLQESCFTHHWRGNERRARNHLACSVRDVSVHILSEIIHDIPCIAARINVCAGKSSLPSRICLEFIILQSESRFSAYLPLLFQSSHIAAADFLVHLEVVEEDCCPKPLLPVEQATWLLTRLSLPLQWWVNLTHEGNGKTHISPRWYKALTHPVFECQIQLHVVKGYMFWRLKIVRSRLN